MPKRKYKEITNSLPESNQSPRVITTLQHAPDIIVQVGANDDPSFLNIKGLGFFSMLSRELYHSNKLRLNKFAANHLLTHVVRGRQKEAYQMIKANPELLMIPGEALDYSGRTIKGTAFMGALGAGDKPMYTMMLPFLTPEDALSQFNAQFPNGVVAEDASTLKARYLTLIHSIRFDADNGKTAIEEFRTYITARKEIKQGLHFNLQELVAAWQAYEEFDNLTCDNRALFCQQIIGYIERQFTAFDAQVYRSGIQGILDNESPRKRSFNLGGTKVFFPLSEESGRRLGVDFWVYDYYGLGGRGAGRPGNEEDWVALTQVYGPGSIHFVERKQMHLTSLEERLRQECIVSNSNVV